MDFEVAMSGGKVRRFLLGVIEGGEGREESENNREEEEVEDYQVKETP